MEYYGLLFGATNNKTRSVRVVDADLSLSAAAIKDLMMKMINSKCLDTTEVDIESIRKCQKVTETRMAIL